jgi:UDP:flavonoid glycosyltransferase YjiC (YdhE family)
MAIFGDQMANAVLIEKEGWGLSAPLDSISEDSLTKTVKDVLENPKYE